MVVIEGVCTFIWTNERIDRWLASKTERFGFGAIRSANSSCNATFDDDGEFDPDLRSKAISFMGNENVKPRI